MQQLACTERANREFKGENTPAGRKRRHPRAAGTKA